MLSQITAGIEITSERINIALVNQTKKGLELLKSASAPMPEGVMSEGNIKNPYLLAKAIKELSAKNNISTRRVVVSANIKPCILRIMEMPKDLAGNPSQYVRDELKHYPVMTGKTIVHDVCSISPNTKTKSARLLCGAADEDKITELLKAFNRAGIYIKAVEPPIIACARFAYAKYIAKKFKTNVLIAAMQDTTMVLCVFRDSTLDFVRSYEMGEYGIESREGVDNLLEEVHAVKQFYDVEMEDPSKAWEMIFVGSRADQNHEQLQKELQNGSSDTNVCIISSAEIKKHSMLICEQESHASPVSAGLAMKYFKTQMTGLEMNLLPLGADEMHNVQKFALTAAAIAIVATLLSFGLVPILQFRMENVSKTIETYKQKQSNEDTIKLLTEMASLSEKNKELTETTQALNAIIESTDSVRNWANILADISSRTPKNVRITNLTTKDNDSIAIFGQSSSYDNINKFIKLLDKSPYITSANLVKSEMDPAVRNLLVYNIICRFSAKGTTNAN